MFDFKKLKKIFENFIIGVKDAFKSHHNKKNNAKTSNAPIYQNEGPANSGNITINGGSSEYAAKLARYEALKAKKRGAWFLWSWDKDQPEFEALEKWIREHASD